MLPFGNLTCQTHYTQDGPIKSPGQEHDISAVSVSIKCTGKQGFQQFKKKSHNFPLMNFQKLYHNNCFDMFPVSDNREKDKEGLPH